MEAHRSEERQENDNRDGCHGADKQHEAAATKVRAVAAVESPTYTVFEALGNQTRYRLARVLAAADGEQCVCELTPVVDVGESAVSHALSDLVDAGLATRRKDGTWRYYQSTELARILFETVDDAVRPNE